MVTMDDVARAAGVSTMTVSNVLNGHKKKVSDQTTRRVLHEVARLGYVPNSQARALSGGNSGIVAVAYTTGGEYPLSNPHDAQFVGTVEAAVNRSGRYLMIRSSADALETVAALRTWNVDGAIFLGIIGDEARELMEMLDIPAVFVDNYADDLPLDTVNIDDYRGGYLAGEFLVQQGHKEIGFLGPHRAEVGVMRERWEGFRQALAEAGLAVRPEHLWEMDAHFDLGLELGLQLAAGTPPTAIFATADITALGVMRGLEDGGLRVPEDVSLLGFDDLEAGRYASPQLSTIRQDVSAKANLAVQMLVEQMADTDSDPARHAQLPVELVVRESVRRID